MNVANEDFQSILTHLASHINPATTRVFILIYAPDLKQHPLKDTSRRSAASIASSFSNIGHDDVRTPGEEHERTLSSLDPNPMDSPEHSGVNTPRTPALSASNSPAFNNLYAQALSMVDKDTMVLPFTTPTGHIHLIKHLKPEIAYVQEGLTGEKGEIVSQVTGWVGQVIVVVGAEGGHAGLVDSEDEYGRATRNEKGGKWWEKSDKIGLGKGMEVVEGLRVGDDWGRRVGDRQ
jgi:hypothetical protein